MGVVPKDLKCNENAKHSEVTGSCLSQAWQPKLELLTSTFSGQLLHK